jgi:hypothetical protein
MQCSHAVNVTSNAEPILVISTLLNPSNNTAIDGQPVLSSTAALLREDRENTLTGATVFFVFGTEFK